MTDLAHQIEAAVRAVPGVIALYAVDPAIVRSVRELAAGPVSLVDISGPVESPRISVSVGVAAVRGAPTTAATVGDAIRDALPAGLAAEIAVRVSRVSAD